MKKEHSELAAARRASAGAAGKLRALHISAKHLPASALYRLAPASRGRGTVNSVEMHPGASVGEKALDTWFLLPMIEIGAEKERSHL